MDNLADKVEAISNVNGEKMPNPSPIIATDTAEESDFELTLTGFETEMEQQLIKLFKRLSLPFKKANRRLRDMEDIGRQLESTMGEIRTNVQIASADFDRKFSDFFNMTLEMFEHQHHQMEMGEKTLAGIKLCCTGTAADFSDFAAKTEDALTKLGSLDSEGQSSRSSASLRYESERILSELKNQENLIIDGFDKCYSPKDNVENTTRSPVVSTTSGNAGTSTANSVAAAMTQGQPEVVSQAEKMLQTCEQLYQAGFLENKVYTLDVTEDQKQRFCDQTTNGGGWTVPSCGNLAVFLVFIGYYYACFLHCFCGV